MAKDSRRKCGAQNFSVALAACGVPLEGVIAFIGGGGKTTSIYTIASESAAQGKKVFITTTTHMRRPEPENFAQDAVGVKKLLDLKNMAVGGIVSASVNSGIPLKEKITGLPSDEYEVCRCMADISLVEADGARLRPLKAPESWEPVIPSGVKTIALCAGLDALGQSVEMVCHRPHKVLEILEFHRQGKNGCEGKPKTASSLIETEDIALILQRGYIEPLRKGIFPGQNGTGFKGCIAVLLNKADTPALERRGLEVIRLLHLFSEQKMFNAGIVLSLKFGRYSFLV